MVLGGGCYLVGGSLCSWVINELTNFLCHLLLPSSWAVMALEGGCASYEGHLCFGVMACYGINLSVVQATNLLVSAWIFRRANRSHSPFRVSRRVSRPSPPSLLSTADNLMFSSSQRLPPTKILSPSSFYPICLPSFLPCTVLPPIHFHPHLVSYGLFLSSMLSTLPASCSPHNLPAFLPTLPMQYLLRH